MIEILEALQAGGDIAMMAAVVFFMRMDRRILSIELFLKHKLKYGD